MSKSTESTIVADPSPTISAETLGKLQALALGVSAQSADAIKSKLLSFKWQSVAESINAHRAYGEFVVTVIIPALRAVDAKCGVSGKSIVSAMARPSAGFYVPDSARETLPGASATDRAIDCHNHVTADWVAATSATALSVSAELQPCAPTIDQVILLAKIVKGLKPETKTYNVTKSKRLGRLVKIVKTETETETDTATVETVAGLPAWIPALDTDIETLTTWAESYDLSGLKTADLIEMGRAIAATLMLADRVSIDA